MANITAAMVKELREMTGAGMMDCKKALTETDGNMDAAVEVLRKAVLLRWKEAEQNRSRRYCPRCCKGQCSGCSGS